jgi:SAM-dependent methyltransferase
MPDLLSVKELKSIRRTAFSKTFEYDNGIEKITDTSDKNYSFLLNPVVQNIYKYQIQYIYEFSRKILEKNDIKYLDWGCGYCPVSYWLKELGENVISCDVGVKRNWNMIKSKTAIEIMLLEHEYKLPFEDNSFDVVLSFGVLEHVPNDKESLKEIYRILKPNGLFYCLYLPYTLSYSQRIHLRGHYIHDRLYNKKQVKKMLKETNLALLDIWHRGLFPKQSFVPKNIGKMEKLDNWLCNYSILKYFATNIEFVACKKQR